MNPTLVVIPTYNESENLPSILERTLSNYGVDVLVVDDNSPDGTGGIADLIAQRDGRIYVLHREAKQGLGRAYLAGFEWALSRGYSKIFEMDADGSHPPEKVAEMIELLDSFDMVIGSRWIEGGRVVNWPWYRLLMSQAGNAYTRVMLNLSVLDASGGFRGFRAGALRGVGLETIDAKGYIFQIETLKRVLDEQMSVVETPITFAQRTAGKSKMNFAIALESLLKVTQWGLRLRWDTKPVKRRY